MDEWREAVDQEADDGEGRGATRRDRPPPGDAASARASCPAREAEEGQVHGERGLMAQADPAARDGHADDQAQPGADGDDEHADRDRAAFSSTRRERPIGCASTSPRIPLSSSPAVEPAAAVMAVAAITSGPYTAPISLRIQPVIVP